MKATEIMSLNWDFYEHCFHSYIGSMIGPGDEWIEMFCAGGEL